MLRKPVFEGLATALVTPFTKNTVDYDTLNRLLDQQLRARADAIVVCGTTGEAAAMRDEEQFSVIAHCVSYVKNRCKIIAGTGSNDTMHAKEKTQEVCRLGADAVLCVSPYYNKCTQNGIIAHYEAIADSSDVPVIVYNVPSRTGVNILPETYAELSRHEKINGVKEADTNISKVAKTLCVCPKDFTVWSGNDDMAVSEQALGAKGLISVVSNLYPEKTRKMIRLCRKGSYKAAAKIQMELTPVLELLFAEVNPIPIKKALELSGFPVGIPRLPLTEASETLTGKLSEYLKNGAKGSFI